MRSENSCFSKSAEKDGCFVTGHGEGHDRVLGKRQERVRVKRALAVCNFMGYFDEYAW